MKRFLFPVLTLSIIASALLYACSGGGSGGGTFSTAGASSTKGTVGLYLTDDMSMYTQVTATVERVQLVSTGTGTSCDLLNAPVSVNISNMAGIMQLVDVTQCPSGPYNRYRIEFDKSVQLVSGTSGTPSLCFFTSYMKHGHGNPNKLACDPATDICTLDITGAVNVLAQMDNKVALDFDLKNFIVANLGMPNCTVTMKVHPLTPRQMQPFIESITGLVSNLSTTAMTFDLTTRSTRTFSVLYSGISGTAQPDLDTLLQRAQDEQLWTQVTSSTIDFPTNTITADKIEVKVAGTISGVTGTSFTLYSGQTGTIVVDYGAAVVSGIPVDGSWIRVKLIGHDQASGDFIADKVEVGCTGIITEN
jgi:hypothetical protein